MDKEKEYQIKLHKKLVSHYRRRHESTVARLYHQGWNDNLISLACRTGERVSKVLDLGAGNGVLSTRLAERGFRVIASDISFDMITDIEKSRENIEGVVQADGECLPFAEKSFDAVFCRGVLHHVPSPGLMLFEIRRILKPGGVLVFSEPCGDGLLLRGLRTIYRKYSRKLGEDHQAFRSRELSALLSEAFLHEVHLEKFGFVAFPLCGMTDYLPLLTKFPFQERIFSILNRFDLVCGSIPLVRRESWGVTLVARRSQEQNAALSTGADYGPGIEEPVLAEI